MPDATYTPTTEAVKDAYWEARAGHDDEGHLDDRYGEEFVRWLTAHDAEIAANARNQERQAIVERLAHWADMNFADGRAVEARALNRAQHAIAANEHREEE